MLNKKEERYIENEVQKINAFLRRETGGPGLNQFSELTKHVYLSSWVGASNREALVDYKIERVICLSGEKKPRSLMDTYDVNNIEHKALPLIDSPEEDISRYFELVYTVIHTSVENDENILIHCHAGSSLSPAFVIYYYLKRFYMTNFGRDVKKDRELVDPQNFNLIEVIKFVKQYRSCIDPNAEFIHQLLMAETFIKKRLREHVNAQIEVEKTYKREKAIKDSAKRKKDKEEKRSRPKSKKVEFSESEESEESESGSYDSYSGSDELESEN